jgi:hypothetical protein
MSGSTMIAWLVSGKGAHLFFISKLVSLPHYSWWKVWKTTKRFKTRCRWLHVLVSAEGQTLICRRSKTGKLGEMRSLRPVRLVHACYNDPRTTYCSPWVWWSWGHTQRASEHTMVWRGMSKSNELFWISALPVSLRGSKLNFWKLPKPGDATKDWEATKFLGRGPQIIRETSYQRLNQNLSEPTGWRIDELQHFFHIREVRNSRRTLSGQLILPAAGCPETASAPPPIRI